MTRYRHCNARYLQHNGHYCRSSTCSSCHHAVACLPSRHGPSRRLHQSSTTCHLEPLPIQCWPACHRLWNMTRYRHCNARYLQHNGHYCRSSTCSSCHHAVACLPSRHGPSRRLHQSSTTCHLEPLPIQCWPACHRLWNMTRYRHCNARGYHYMM